MADDRVDGERSGIGDLRKHLRGPLAPARLVGRDIEKGVAVDEDSGHSPLARAMIWSVVMPVLPVPRSRWTAPVPRPAPSGWRLSTATPPSTTQSTSVSGSSPSCSRIAIGMVTWPFGCDSQGLSPSRRRLTGKATSAGPAPRPPESGPVPAAGPGQLRPRRLSGSSGDLARCHLAHADFGVRSLPRTACPQAAGRLRVGGGHFEASATLAWCLANFGKTDTRGAIPGRLAFQGAWERAADSDHGRGPTPGPESPFARTCGILEGLGRNREAATGTWSDFEPDIVPDGWNGAPQKCPVLSCALHPSDHKAHMDPVPVGSLEDSGHAWSTKR